MKKKIILSLLLPLQILIVWILGHFPEFVEQYYSRGIYPVISKISRIALGWIPFSFGDVMYLAAIFFFIRWIIKKGRFILQNPKDILLDITATFSIIYFCFYATWGLNYMRQPLHEVLGIKEDFTNEELWDYTNKLIVTCNQQHLNLVTHDSIPVVLPYTKKDIYRMTTDGYDNLSKTFPALTYSPRSIKHSLLSLPLTYMGFSGYLNPFTIEAQVNSMIPAYKFPTTACHEEAHQLGFAAEDETNFMGLLATVYHDDPYFQYCGYTNSLKYCLREIQYRDQDLYKDFEANVNLGIRKNFAESKTFWKKYDNPFEIIYKKIFDKFLKLNKQKKGLRSYQYVVGLLINYDLNTESDKVAE